MLPRWVARHKRCSAPTYDTTFVAGGAIVTVFFGEYIVLFVDPSVDGILMMMVMFCSGVDTVMMLIAVMPITFSLPITRSRYSRLQLLYIHLLRWVIQWSHLDAYSR